MFFRTKPRALTSQRAHADATAQLGRISGLLAKHEVVGAVRRLLVKVLPFVKQK